MGELGVGGALRHWEMDGGEDLVGFERRLEEAGEEIVGRDPAAIGLDRRPQGEHGGGIVGGRVGMSE